MFVLGATEGGSAAAVIYILHIVYKRSRKRFHHRASRPSLASFNVRQQWRYQRPSPPRLKSCAC